MLRILGAREYNDRDPGNPFSFREPRQELETGFETGSVRQPEVEDDERWKWIPVPVVKLELSPYGGQVCTRDSSDLGVLLFVVDGRHLAEG